MRLAVWRCFLGRLRSSSRIRSMTPVKGSSLGRRGGICLRYPGGTEYASILRTVSRCRPNVRAASRMLIPSTITALLTRRYTSTLYIRRTIHGVGYNPMNDGRRYSIWSPILSNPPPTQPTLTPPFTPADSTKRLSQNVARHPTQIPAAQPSFPRKRSSFPRKRPSFPRKREPRALGHRCRYISRASRF